MDTLKTLKLALNRRWAIDAAKLYLTLALIFLFVSVRAYSFTFEPPPENELNQATGKVTTIEMYRGFVYEVATPGRETIRLTCHKGHNVYCPEAKGLIEDVDVTVKYAAERPELLLSMEQAGKPILPYSFLSRMYRFSGIKPVMLWAGFALLALFAISPLIHKANTNTNE